MALGGDGVLRACGARGESAAFAAVQLRGSEVGRPWIGLAGAVPAYLLPSAAAAERLALAVATLVVAKGQASAFRSDCASAVSEFGGLAVSSDSLLEGQARRQFG